MFKYGSFFGLTAVHVMFMRAKDIDRLFKYINMKPSTISLIKNLYNETKLLREIFSPTSTEPGIPHVVMKKDLQDPKVQCLIKGLNCFVASKKSMEFPEASSEDLAGLEALSELEDLDMSGTSFFSEDTAKQEESTNSENDDPFAALADIGDIDTTDSINLENIYVEPVKSYTFEDLIFWGENENPSEEVVSNLPSIARYMRSHRDDFSDDEYNSITKQIAELPSIPVGVQLPETLKQATAPISENSLMILQVLYQKMTRKIEGISFVDFVISRLEMVLLSSNESGKLLFFAPASDFSRDKSVFGSNLFIANLQAHYLQTDRMNALTSNINVLLDNCNEVLGITQTSDERAKLDSLISTLRDWQANPVAYPIDLQQECENNLLEFAGIKAISDNERKSISGVIAHMVSSGMIMKLIENPDNLRMLLLLYAIMYTTITQEMYTALKLYQYIPEQHEALDLDLLNEYCVKLFYNFTTETGICGFYFKFEESYFSTLQNIESPLTAKTRDIFSPSSVKYRMAHLLRLHLLSLRKRLSRRGVN